MTPKEFATDLWFNKLHFANDRNNAVAVITVAVEAELAEARAQIAAKDVEIAKWQKAFAAQSSKLQSVLHIPGVKETLNGQR